MAKTPTKSIMRITIEKDAVVSMSNPPHPGEIIREDCMAAVGLTVAATAEGLGVPTQALSDLIEERKPVSPELALRLELAGWGSAEGWLRGQAVFDLWHVKRDAGALQVHRFTENLSA